LNELVEIGVGEHLALAALAVADGDVLERAGGDVAVERLDRATEPGSGLCCSLESVRWGVARLARGLSGRAQAVGRRWERRRFLPLHGRFIAIDLATDRLERVDASRNLSTVLQQTRRGGRVLLCCLRCRHDAVRRIGGRIGAVSCQRSFTFLIGRLLGFRFRYGLAGGFFEDCPRIAAAIPFFDFGQLLERAAHVDKDHSVDHDLGGRTVLSRPGID